MSKWRVATVWMVEADSEQEAHDVADAMVADGDHPAVLDFEGVRTGGILDDSDPLGRIEDES